MPNEGTEGAFRNISLSLRESQVDWLKRESLRRGVSASDVMREIFDHGQPLYEQDQTLLAERRAAREAAV